MKKKITFDYIVVGTGPAGAVLAKILSDDKKTSVLVLEAGENRDKDVPIRDSTQAPELEENFFPQYFWQGEGTPQEGVDDRAFEWTTGRLAGGGSSINGEQYVRPTAEVMEKWERLLGNLWSPEKVVQRFKRLERYTGETTDASAHGYHGRIDIRQAPAEPTAMAEKLTDAIEKATGFPRILDYNDPDTPLGPFTRWQLFQKRNGERESASTAFLSADVVTPAGRGVRGRKLTVRYQATALGILFSRKRAIGVEYLQAGKCVRAYARKKVILSAGINSAQLLMLSGIGPAGVLREANIPVIYDNPNVGQRLRNHTLNFAVFSANRHDRALPANDPAALYTGGAFLPDPTGLDPHRRAVQLIGIGSRGMLTVAILYLRPKSRGSITIQNKDPLTIVLADEGFLANPDDMEAVKNIYKIYIKNIASELALIDPSYRLVSPDPAVIDNDAQLEAFIKDNFDHNHHQQGSLRMAPLRKGGVVDRAGKVHGVKDLIVADASIIPFTVDGNTSASAYLIGYTIARRLRGETMRRKGRDLAKMERIEE
ncbi:GMC family oxidoreductase [Paenibacillus dendritiformis]|uniref:GMC family oxidoreductase n=1 Tax=Paenibacillus dendritiformis TaxID=130049 RepID=UPI00143E09B3|nr:GMC family oxidoreductase [Paenibacillus dendritiformis]NKI22475.1 GMC family oxidoreductase [Paenibacillus dendritiformis]NRF97515.1 GMC family oxidoreductase [Paenibacillus dendritiformis]